MTLINFEGGKVNQGEIVRLKAANSEAMKLMTVVVVDYVNDRLVLAEGNGTLIAVSPDCWCLVYPE